jgi:cell division protein FtsQ
MTSTSGRRSGSSDDSTRRRERRTGSGTSDRPTVYISTRGRDRSLDDVRSAAEEARGGARAGGGQGRGARTSRRTGEPGKQLTRAQSDALDRRNARGARESARRRAVYLRSGLVFAGVLLSLLACVAVYRSDLFSISRVEILGNVRLSADRVRALAKVPADATLIRFPAAQVAARVSADPWVAEVTVTRVFPDAMRIRVVERRPAAMVDAGATLWLIDGAGMVLGKRSLEQTATMVVIRDVPGLALAPGKVTSSGPLLNAVAVLEGLSTQLRSRVGSVSAPTEDGTTLYTRDKIEIVFGEASDVRAKDALVRRILEEQKGKVISIDVRTLDRPTWRGLPD